MFNDEGIPQFAKRKLAEQLRNENLSVQEEMKQVSNEQSPEKVIDSYLERIDELLSLSEEEEKKSGERRANEKMYSERGIRTIKRLIKMKIIYGKTGENIVDQTTNREREEMALDRMVEAKITSQKDAAEVLGRSNIQVTDELKQKFRETLKQELEESIDEWVDYLSSSDSPVYPLWFKYFIITNISKLGQFDQLKSRFKERRKDTFSPLPELNQEALSYVYEKIKTIIEASEKSEDEKKQKIEEVSKPRLQAAVSDDARRVNKKRIKLSEKMKKGLQGFNFRQLYEVAYENTLVDNLEYRKITTGEWVKFDMGTSGQELANSLKGWGTGWCTATETTASEQLKGGDFYVYYSDVPQLDSKGKPLTDERGNVVTRAEFPRVAIRMEDGRIVELRGIEPGQEMEDIMVDIADSKMRELPGYEEYIKKSENVKRIRRLLQEKKKAEREGNVVPDYTPDDLRFIYEVDGEVEGFGSGSHPKLKEIKEGRTFGDDYMRIFGVDTQKEAALCLIEAGQAWVVVMHSERFEGLVLNKEIAMKMIEVYQASVVVRHLRKFEGLDKEVALKLIEAGKALAVFMYSKKFEGLVLNKEIAMKMIEAGEASAFINHLEKFEGLDKEVALKLIEAGKAWVVFMYPEKFEGLVLNKEIAIKMIEAGKALAFIKHLEKFEGLDKEVALKLIEAGKALAVAKYPERFEGLDEEVMSKLI